MCLIMICTPLSAPSTYLVYRWELIHSEFENLQIELHLRLVKKNFMSPRVPVFNKHIAVDLTVSGKFLVM